MKYDGKLTIKTEVASDMFKEKYDNGEFEVLPASS